MLSTEPYLYIYNDFDFCLHADVARAGCPKSPTCFEQRLIFYEKSPMCIMTMTFTLVCVQIWLRRLCMAGVFAAAAIVLIAPQMRAHANTPTVKPTLAPTRVQIAPAPPYSMPAAPASMPAAPAPTHPVPAAPASMPAAPAPTHSVSAAPASMPAAPVLPHPMQDEPAPPHSTPVSTTKVLPLPSAVPE